MTSEYVTDTTYVRHFDPDLAPSRFRLIAALNAFAPPPSADFDYCELGCAHGDTLIALAAANPRARFTGVDLNPAHIASATALANASDVRNVRFFARDFTTLSAAELGAFDYVAAHGVLSWVSVATRAAMLALVSSILRDGGLFYVSYNAMPGWSAVEPLRQLLLSPLGAGVATAPSSGSGESSLDRARRGLEFARTLAEGGAEYFRANPTAHEMLATMENAGLSYVVHEYMHASWAPMYFAHVAWEMAAHDLKFVGVLPAYLNFRDMAVPAALRKVFEGITDRSLFESLRDFATNEFFRRDLYVKGNAPRAASVTAAYLDATPLGLVGNEAPSPRARALPHRTLSFDGPLYDALFDELGAGAKTARALASSPRIAEAGPDKLRNALVRLLVADLVLPLLRETHANHAALSRALHVPSAYNRATLAELAGDRPIVMASEASGAGVPLTTLEGLALRALTEVAPDEVGEWARAFFRDGKITLRVQGEAITDAEAKTRVLTDAVRALREGKLAKLVELGVVTSSR